MYDLKYIFFLQSEDYEPLLPVSEKSNLLTRDIDQASPGSIVKMLQVCDAQMFQEDTGATYQVKVSQKNTYLPGQNGSYRELSFLEAAKRAGGENVNGGC